MFRFKSCEAAKTAPPWAFNVKSLLEDIRDLLTNEIHLSHSPGRFIDRCDRCAPRRLRKRAAGESARTKEIYQR